MVERLEERKARDLHLIESMERNLKWLEEDLEEYGALAPAELLGLMRRSIDNTRDLIRRLRGEVSKDAV